MRFPLNRYDTDKDKSLNFNELKFLMEKLGLPQTHLSLKAMIQRVDENQDGKISFREVNRTSASSSSSLRYLFLVFGDFSQNHFGKRTILHSLPIVCHAFRNRCSERRRRWSEDVLRSQGKLFSSFRRQRKLICRLLRSKIARNSIEKFVTNKNNDVESKKRNFVGN